MASFLVPLHCNFKASQTHKTTFPGCYTSSTEPQYVFLVAPFTGCCMHMASIPTDGSDSLSLTLTARWLQHFAKSKLPRS